MIQSVVEVSLAQICRLHEVFSLITRKLLRNSVSSAVTGNKYVNYDLKYVQNN